MLRSGTTAATQRWLRAWWPIVLALGTAAALVILVVFNPGGSSTQDGLITGFGELTLDDIDVDAATGLPIVPPLQGNERWWWVEEPDRPLDPAARFTSAAPASSPVDTRHDRVSLLAAFPDHDAAVEVARSLAAAAGDARLESAWLVAHGQPGDQGFGWLGDHAAISPFVQVIDGLLLVGSLEYAERYDRWESTPLESELVYRSPLTSALADSADYVLVEGDRSGEGAIAFDAMCAGDPGRLLPLSQDLADHGFLSQAQPPWMPPGIDEGQRRARRTLRLMRTLQGAALGEVLFDDPEFTRLNRAASSAADSGDVEAIRDAISNLRVYIVDAMPDVLPDLGPLAATLDPAVVSAEVALYAELLANSKLDRAVSGSPGTDTERISLDERYGPAVASSPSQSGDAYFEVGLHGRELVLWSGVWAGIAEGLGPLVDALVHAGCGEIRVTFHDFDDVRAD